MYLPIPCMPSHYICIIYTSATACSIIFVSCKSPEISLSKIKSCFPNPKWPQPAGEHVDMISSVLTATFLLSLIKQVIIVHFDHGHTPVIYTCLNFGVTMILYHFSHIQVAFQWSCRDFVGANLDWYWTISKFCRAFPKLSRCRIFTWRDLWATLELTSYRNGVSRRFEAWNVNHWHTLCWLFDSCSGKIPTMCCIKALATESFCIPCCSEFKILPNSFEFMTTQASSDSLMSSCACTVLSPKPLDALLYKLCKHIVIISIIKKRVSTSQANCTRRCPYINGYLLSGHQAVVPAISFTANMISYSQSLLWKDWGKTHTTHGSGTKPLEGKESNCATTHDQVLS